MNGAPSLPPSAVPAKSRRSREGGNPEIAWDRKAAGGKRFWIPAFAGMGGVGQERNRRQALLDSGFRRNGRGGAGTQPAASASGFRLSPEWAGWDRNAAGGKRFWIPAFAGMGGVGQERSRRQALLDSGFRRNGRGGAGTQPAASASGFRLSPEWAGWGRNAAGGKRFWIPAFAGMGGVGQERNRRQALLDSGFRRNGRGGTGTQPAASASGFRLSPEWAGWDRNATGGKRFWIPAKAGMGGVGWERNRRQALLDSGFRRNGRRTEAVEGGYEARAPGYGIFTQGDDWEELKDMARDAVLCHFDDEDLPRAIRLHLVKDEVLAV